MLETGSLEASLPIEVPDSAAKRSEGGSEIGHKPALADEWPRQRESSQHVPYQ
jgi:hypothetical protein